MVTYKKVPCNRCGIHKALENGIAVIHENGWVYATSADPCNDRPYWSACCHGSGFVTLVGQTSVLNDDDLLNF